MNKNYIISLSILLILQSLHITASPQQPTAEEQKKAIEGLSKIIDERIDKKLQSMPTGKKASQLSDQDKQMIAGLHRAPAEQLFFTHAEEPAAEIMRNVLKLDDELKGNKDHRMSLEHFIIQSLQNEAIEYHAQSKAPSHGWLDLGAHISLLWNGKYANQNKFDISIKQSIEFPGNFELIIHAQGTCDTTNKDLQSAHCQLAAYIKNNPNFTRYANFAAIKSLEQFKRDTRLQGESSGVCYTYGCQKKIRILCDQETLIMMLQEKNSSKHTLNTTQDEPFVEKLKPAFNFNTPDFITSMQNRINPAPQSQKSTTEDDQEDEDEDEDEDDDDEAVDSEEDNDTEVVLDSNTSTENK